MATAAIIVPALIAATGTIVTGVMQSNAAKSQAQSSQAFAHAQAQANQNAVDQQTQYNIAAADQQAEWADRNADEEMVAAQQKSANRLREMEQAQSRLVALAASDGSGITEDDSVTDLYGDIQEEGANNAGLEMAGGSQRATTLRHNATVGQWQARTQGALDKTRTGAQNSIDLYKADAQARIDKAGARSTLIGSAFNAASTVAGGYAKIPAKTPMAARYGSSWTGQLRYG